MMTNAMTDRPSDDVVVINGPMPRARGHRTKNEMCLQIQAEVRRIEAEAIEDGWVDGEIMDGEAPPSRKNRSWRYPEIYRLQPGQCLLYKWSRFKTADPPKTMGVLMSQIRRQRGW